MPRYIDADKLKQRKRHIEIVMSGGKLYDGYDYVKFSDIDETPTADVQEVRPGKWLLEREPNGKPYCFHCSVCDSDFARISIVSATPFCPYCGAKMDEKEE